METQICLGQRITIWLSKRIPSSAVNMNRESGPAEMCAWVLALLTVLASVIVIFTHGVVKVSSYSGIHMEKTYNLPLIIGCVITAIYAVLYAILFSEVQKISAKNDVIMKALGIRQVSSKEATLADVISNAGVEVNSSPVSLASEEAKAEVEKKNDQREPLISPVLVAITLGFVLLILILTNLV
ncbi:hypothetical protein ACVFVO_16065 [Advenella kashmirensis]